MEGESEDTVERIPHSKKLAFVALAALAIVLTINVPSEARAGGGHGFDGHHGFEGHHFDRGFHRRFGFGFAPVFPYYGYDPYYYPPAYGYDAPSYDWYCPRHAPYYPSVPSCPQRRVLVPASLLRPRRSP